MGQRSRNSQRSDGLLTDRKCSAQYTRMPPRFRSFYRLDDDALQALGLARQTLQLFNPLLQIGREDLF